VLEGLEDRLAPASYDWTGFGADDFWETPTNWATADGPVNGYPGWDGSAATTNDIATFTGALNFNARMQASHELHSLNLDGYTGTLRLQAQLTLHDGGFMRSGTIIQKEGAADGPILIVGGTFEWRGGNINYAPGVLTAASTIMVAGGDLSFTNAVGSPGGNVGSNIDITSGTLTLSNTGSVTLVNRPTITNNGTIDITVNNDGGLVVAAGDRTTIQNNGLIIMTGGGAGIGYWIDDPVLNTTTSSAIQVNQGSLRFRGADSTTGRSVDQTNGRITILSGADLSADNYVRVGGGVMEGSPGGTITGNLEVAGGTLIVGSPSAPSGYFYVFGNVWFSMGTMRFYYNTATASGTALSASGTTGISITYDTTAVDVTFIGGGQQPASLDVMRAIAGTITSICAINPEGFTASIVEFVNQFYRLRRI
jgi:hypothetical protein